MWVNNPKSLNQLWIWRIKSRRKPTLLKKFESTLNQSNSRKVKVSKGFSFWDYSHSITYTHSNRWWARVSFLLGSHLEVNFKSLSNYNNLWHTNIFIESVYKTTHSICGNLTLYSMNVKWNPVRVWGSCYDKRLVDFFMQLKNNLYYI